MAKLTVTVALLVLSACSSGTSVDAGTAKARTKSDAGGDAGTAHAASNAAPLRGLAGVWGTGVDDVWAVGEAGTILHYDGKQWTASESFTTASLHAVGGSGPHDVWAVGDSIVLHWDGKRWSDALIDPNLQETLLSVWSSGPGSVFMVGFTTDTNRGMLRHGKGAEWNWVEISSGAMWEVWGSGPSDVWLGGTGEKGAGFLDRGDGANFKPTAYNGGSVRGIWGASSDDVWAVPYKGKFQHWDGSSWTAFAVPGTAAIIAAAGSGPKDVWAVGLQGTILHWDGDSWTSQASGTNAGLFSVWAANAKDAWAVGEGGVLLHWNGSDWRNSSAR